MNRRRISTIATALSAFAIALASCGRENRADRAATEYAALVRESVELYSLIEPLRSSRLGMTGADSLLFTFSDDELSRSIERLKQLENGFSRFSVSGLAPRDVDNAEVIVYWLRGEIFALEELQSFRYNPLLYCWAVEEALWGIPSRVESPYAGELAAYRARLGSIPALLANARRLLDNPAEAHGRYAMERLDSIAGAFGRLDAAIRQRYGESIGVELDRARHSVEAFRGFVGDSLLARSRGTLILGAENLSKVFLYDELINADPNVIIGKAESGMRRLKGLRESLAKRIEIERRGSIVPAGRAVRGTAVRKASSTVNAAPVAREASGTKPQARAPRLDAPRKAAGAAASGGAEPFDAKVNRLLRELAPDSAGGVSGAAGAAKLVIRYPVRTGYHSFLSKSPSLTIPRVENSPLEILSTAPFAAPPCLSYAFFSGQAHGLEENELLARLLRATDEALEMDALRCEERDSVRAIFSSETFREGWFYLCTRDRTADLRTENPELGLLLLGDEILALARTVVVFRLHAGTTTSNEAAEYLVQSTGISREAAAREILAASISPGLAYRGIAIVLVDGMMETIAYLSGLDRPERRLTEAFHANRGLPLPIIDAKISKD